MAKKAKGGKKGKKGKKKKKRKKKAKAPPVDDPNARCGYLLDLVIAAFAPSGLASVKINALEVDVTFNEISLKLTSSRINVVDFVPDRTVEFDVDTRTICGLMESSPLQFAVRNGDQVLGTGVIPWPENVIESVKKRELVTQFLKAHLTVENEEEEKKKKNQQDQMFLQDRTSKEERDEEGPPIEFFVRLQPKCYEIPDPFLTCLPSKCEAAQKAISPNDVIFLVGNELRAEVCPEGIPLNPVRKNERLDFAAYRMYHGAIKGVTPELPNTFCSLDCCRVKELTREFGPGVFDRLHCNKELREAEKREEKSVCIKSISPEISPTTSMDDLVDKRTVAEMSDCSQPKKESLLKNKSSFGTDTYAKGRRCPVCKIKLKYLEPRSPCPICGMQPTVEWKEKKPQEFTLEEIMDDYILKNPPKDKECLDCIKNEDTDATLCRDPNDDIPEYCPCLEKICRCRCKESGVCAYCRVRNACDIVDLRDYDPDNEPAERKNIDEGCELGPDEEEVFRPFIERVFMELLDIYKIDEEADKTCKAKAERYERSAMIKKSMRPVPGRYQSYNMTPTICKETKGICRHLSAPR